MDGTKKFPEALQAFTAAEKLDGAYAELHYFMGRCFEALNQTPAAKEHYETACDLDTLRFRTDRALNAVIRKMAGQFENENLLFLDVPGPLASSSAQGIPGEDFFYEHVHFNFAGQLPACHQYCNAIVSRVAATARGVHSSTWLSQEECRERLAFTPWNQLQILENLQARFQKPPFTLQPGHLARLAQLSNTMAI